MRFWRYGVIALGVFFSINVLTASATTGILSNDPAHAQQFSFYCGPYIRSFEVGKHYIVNDTTCTYSIPNTLAGGKIVTLYQGLPGVSATPVGGDLIMHGGTLISQTPNIFGNLQNESDLFAVIYDPTLDQTVEPLKDYLQGVTSILPGGVVEGQNFYIIPWKWGPKPPSEFDPVVIIPGILGSWEKNGEWILDPITHIYDNLVDTLLANGYVEGQTLFKFPYDWRKSNVVTAQLLGNKVAEIKNICNCSYVDIVAHSMGGLAASQYVSSDSYDYDIDQMLFLGTPMAGAPKAYKTWEAGEVDFGNDTVNLVMQRVFTKESRDFGFNTVLDYVRSGMVPSVQELLPIYNYLATDTEILPYPTGYPQNTFLENLLQDFISKAFGNTRLHVIVGNTGDASTPIMFTVASSTQPSKWEHGEPVTTEWGPGDDTVPYHSSTYSFGPDKELVGANHTQLVAASTSYVFETLNNTEPETVIAEVYGFRQIDRALLIKHIAPSSGDFRVAAETIAEIIFYENPLVQKVLTIILYSPIDVEVTAPDGKRVGKDLTTGAAINEIPNAVYSGPIENYEHVIILDPLPGEYKVKTKGTGSGSYTIATGYADTATTSISFVNGTTTLNQVTENTMFLSPTTTSAVIKEDMPPPTPPVEQITPATCVKDMEQAYKNKWIGKKQVYQALVAHCKSLGVLIQTRDKLKIKLLQAGVNTAIRLVLSDMEKLAKDKNNKKEAVALITKNTKWFREHEVK